MTVVIFILLLVLLILVHEFGHFIVAKAFGIRVDEFGIGFPPKAFSVKWGETEYSLNVLPFGGFVRIYGENAPPEGASAGEISRSFVHKPRYIQAAVILAGIVFNFLFAWLALSLGYAVGLPTSQEHVGFGDIRDRKTEIVQVLPGSPAEKSGIVAGDTVIALHTATAELLSGIDADHVQAFISAHQNETVILTLLRSGVEKNILTKPIEGIAPDHKAIGIQLDDVGVLQLPIHLALLEGGILGWRMTQSIAVGLGSFFYNIAKGTADLSGVSGPIGIAGIGATAVHDGLTATLILMSLISINLALINLLPIPGLDGGRLFFILIEAITRRSISERVGFALTLVGFALLGTLMLVVSYHDVIRLVHPV